MLHEGMYPILFNPNRIVSHFDAVIVDRFRIRLCRRFWENKIWMNRHGISRIWSRGMQCTIEKEQQQKKGKMRTLSHTMLNKDAFYDWLTAWIVRTSFKYKNHLARIYLFKCRICYASLFESIRMMIYDVGKCHLQFMFYFANHKQIINL